ncbi:hypothetical protein D3H65_09360 [Paraflavitalea soli]|uniref:Uncharacterized protein n=1 Tax=Paraflavitalea soli TaxID=2315862 RepID=A0A3B7MLI8_9BACT|nr:hypothetical protein [Paraflavitalea soli]AXY74169.1 hypothetical protein D3H65_09360 [Paraflavitalea soli]
MKQTMIGGEIVALIEKKKGICISIIVPAHRFSPEKRSDKERLDKSIQRAIKHLLDNYPPEQVIPLIEAMDELYQQVDFTHTEAGIGLFVSPDIHQLVYFIYPVKEKMMIGESFDIRDLLYQDYYSRVYFVLMLSEQGAKLFQARLNKLEEVHDSHFPLTNEDEYEYQRPIYGSAGGKTTFIKAIERDKSQLEEIRYTQFLKKVVEGLDNNLTLDTPMIVTGTKKDLGYYSKVTHHTDHVFGLLPGNFSHLSLNELGALTWPIMKSFLDDWKQQQVIALQETHGKAHVLTTLQDIWKAVQEGRGARLLVEKDLSIPAYLSNDNGYQLHLHPPKGRHRILPDVINSLMETVLAKHGEVIMLENGFLENFQRMLLVTRY